MTEGGQQKSFIILQNCSLPPQNGLTQLWSYHFHHKLLPGLSIREASARSYNTYIMYSLGEAVQENIW